MIPIRKCFRASSVSLPAMIRSQSRSCQLLVTGMITAVAQLRNLTPMMVDRRKDGKT